MPAKKHNFTVTEVKAGALVLVSLAVLIAFIAAITGMRPPEKTTTFNAYFTDSAGLNKGADVRFGGAKVGRVTEISLDPKDQSRIRVVASVREGIPVNAKSLAYITQTTLTSEKHLEISTGEKDAALLKDGAEIPSKSGGLFDQADALASSVRGVLKDVEDLLGVRDAKEKAAKEQKEMATIASIFKTVDTTVSEGKGLVGDVREVISDKKEDITKVLDRIRDLGESADTLIGDLRGVLSENRENLKGTVAGVRQAIDNAQPIIERLAALSDQLDEIANSLQAALDNATSLTGEAGGIVSDNRPAVEDIVLDLRATVRNLKAFSRTMAEHPEAFIRGKSPEGRK